MIGEPQTFIPPKPVRPRNRLPLVLVALVVLGGGAYWATHRGGGAADAGKGKDKPLPPVIAAEVKQGPVPLELSAVGAVEAYASVAVRAQTAGPLLRVAFQQGQAVKKGQLLFQIDPAPARAALAQAEAAME
ncbi:MAG: mdtA, partial [Cyanobacteria bacterium RYN_339]|nr:mdtA [Cyanobacteria bacterium RYN_339]